MIVRVGWALGQPYASSEVEHRQRLTPEVEQAAYDGGSPGERSHLSRGEHLDDVRESERDALVVEQDLEYVEHAGRRYGMHVSPHGTPSPSAQLPDASQRPHWKHLR